MVCKGRERELTKKELSRYYYLEKEIKRDRDEIEILNTKLTHITQVLSDMPKGSPQRDKIDAIIDELAERDNLLHEKIARAEKERNRIAKNCGTISMGETHAIGKLKEKKEIMML